jgi:DNA-dependent RNA polymerase auxiliary subunit epsilon
MQKFTIYKKITTVLIDEVEIEAETEEEAREYVDENEGNGDIEWVENSNDSDYEILTESQINNIITTTTNNSNPENIAQHPVMQEILADSFGGVMYNVANRDKYDTVQLLALWESLTPAEREHYDGCVTGAIAFIKSN